MNAVSDFDTSFRSLARASRAPLMNSSRVQEERKVEIVEDGHNVGDDFTLGIKEANEDY